MKLSKSTHISSTQKSVNRSANQISVYKPRENEKPPIEVVSTMTIKLNKNDEL